MIHHPYETNPACNVQDQVPLTEEDLATIKRWKLRALPQIIAIILLAAVSIPAIIYASYGELETFGLIAVLVVLLIVSARSIFATYESKVIFDSKLMDMFGVLRVEKAWFEDMRLPVGFTKWTRHKELQVGRRYRVHLLADKNVVLKLEQLD